jgi:TonB family protein
MTMRPSPQVPTPTGVNQSKNRLFGPQERIELLKIDEFGSVQDVTVVNAEPAGYFEESASQAFKAAHFSPAQRDGHPVRSQIVVKVRFTPQLQARD